MPNLDRLVCHSQVGRIEKSRRGGGGGGGCLLMRDDTVVGASGESAEATTRPASRRCKCRGIEERKEQEGRRVADCYRQPATMVRGKWVLGAGRQGRVGQGSVYFKPLRASAAGKGQPAASSQQLARHKRMEQKLAKEGKRPHGSLDARLCV